MKAKDQPQSDSRRQFLRRSLMAGSAGFLGSCGEKQSASSGASQSPGADLKGSLSKESKLCVYTWDEYVDPKLLEDFEAATGIHVDIKIFESSDELVEGLKSEPGAYDVLVCEDGYVPILAGKRMIRPLERRRLPNWKNLDPKYTDQAFDPKNEFSVPYLWGTTLLAYRKDLLIDPQLSWSIVFENRLKDKVGFLDDRMECYAAILRTMNVDLPEAKPGEIEHAAGKLLQLVRDQGMRLGGLSGNEVKQYLLEGSSWLCMIYSGDAARIALENPAIPISYFIPKEGSTVWVDSFCISRDSNRVENAHKFLDFMLEAKNAARSSNFLRYATPNMAAVPFIDSDLLADQTINPCPEVLAKCNFFNLRDVDSKRMVNIGWRQVQEAWMARSGQASSDESDPLGPENSPDTH